MHVRLLNLFFTFLKLGCTAFGGPAMIPYIRKEAVERHKWLDTSEFQLGMALAQIIPGATAMQVAAWVGLRTRGWLGALAAYLGFGIPAFLIMLGLSWLYFNAGDTAAAYALFAGLQAVVIALMLNAVLDFSKLYLKTTKAILLALSTGGWFFMKGNPVVALVLACLASLIIFPEQKPLRDGEPQTHAGSKQNPFIPLVALALGFGATVWLLGGGYPNIALLMAKIDLFAFGGGYVSIPLMLHEVVEVRHWLTATQFMDGIALGQLTPGPIVITATFVGYGIMGIAGAAVATIAVFFPSLLILAASSPFADRVVHSRLASRAFHGSLITLVGLIAAVSLRFVQSMQWSVANALIAIAAFIAIRRGVNILAVVTCGAVLAYLSSF